MRIVIVSEGCCYPADSGARLRTLHLMLPVAQQHDITYVCRGLKTADDARRAEEYFAEQGIRAVVVHDPAVKKSGVSLYTQLVANLCSSLPYTVQAHNSSGVWQALRAEAERAPVDLWQLEWLPYVDAVKDLPGRKLYVAHDVTAQIWERHSQTTTNPMKRWFIKQQWHKMQRYEGRIIGDVDETIAVSDADAELIRRLYKVDNVSVVENGVAPDYHGAVERERKPNQIIYVGALESRPNQDAVRVMLDKIWPEVGRHMPGARLCLVGRNPPPWMQEKTAKIDSVSLHANVPDVRPFLAESSVLAVPLRIAGGSRIKILEALAGGLPVVSTRVGAEGLHLTAGQEIVVVDEPEHMAAALVSALRQPEQMRAMAERGRQIVRERYDWNALAHRAEQIWQATVDRKSGASV